MRRLVSSISEKAMYQRIRSMGRYLGQPLVLSCILAALFTITVARYNAGIAFTTPIDTGIYKISILLKAGFFVFLWIAIYAIIYFVKKVHQKDEFYRRWLRYSTIYGSIILAVFLLIYPGHWVWDEFNILVVVKEYVPYAWQNYFTNIFYTFSLYLFPSAISIVIVQLLVIVSIVGYVAAVAKSLIHSKWAVPLVLLLFSLPPILINNFYPLRLTLYSYVEVLLFTYLLHSYYRTRLRLSYRSMAIVSFMVGILSFWRSEGMYYLFLLPILATYSKLITKKNWATYRTHALLAPSYIIIVALGLVTYLTNDVRYSVTTAINPLSVMLQNPPLKGEHVVEKLADINAVLNLDVLRQYPSYSEIPSYWNGALQPDFSNHLKSFRSAYLYIVLHNPDTFLVARAKTFLAANGAYEPYPPVLPIGLLGRDDELAANERVVAAQFERDNVFTTPINPSVKKTVTRTLLGIDEHNKLTPLGHITWNLFAPLAFLVIVFFHAARKKRWFWVIACVLVLLRFPIIFLTAPASYFMYYLPLYMSGLLIPLFYLLLHLQADTKKKGITWVGKQPQNVR